MSQKEILVQSHVFLMMKASLSTKSNKLRKQQTKHDHPTAVAGGLATPVLSEPSNCHSA